MKLSFRRWWPMKAARSRSMTSEKTRTFPKIYWKLHDHKPFKIRKWLCSVQMMRWLGRGSRIQLYVFGKVIEANWVNPISVCLINPAKSLENMNDHLRRLWRLCENIYIYKSIYIEFILSGGLDRPVWPVILYSFFVRIILNMIHQPVLRIATFAVMLMRRWDTLGPMNGKRYRYRYRYR